MKKNFIQVQRITMKSVRVMLAGITFTLFGISNGNACEGEMHFTHETSAEYQADHACPSTASDENLILAQNEDTTADKMNAAYMTFVAEKDNDNSLDGIYRFMADNMNSIESDKVSIDGSTDDGLLNMAIKLPDGVVLSLTKELDTMENNLIAFNIIRDRQLLVSDIMDINKLCDYINTVQNRLS